SNQGGSEGYANLVNATAYLPGLPLLSLIHVQQVTATADCENGEQPTAHANILGDLIVLGKKVTLSAAGTATVKVAGIGQVSLALSQSETSSTSGAATALHLQVSVNPLKLGVTKVDGDVYLPSASSRTTSGALPPLAR